MSRTSRWLEVERLVIICFTCLVPNYWSHVPDRSHYNQVARRIRTTLGKKSSITLERTQVTDLIREVSSEDSTRMKSAMAAEVEIALLAQGFDASLSCSTQRPGIWCGSSRRLAT
jgi:hypothetical protein